mmetsp:Transcript_7714/g.10647  ORF Transcript_7714/g.10647 Transcript_7714/m.10647 type:complete len:888 (-) Transcript_7714:2-2665(-)
MVHNAFNTHSIIDKLPLKIECIEVWGDTKLLVGTNEGVLFTYEVKEKKDGQQIGYTVTLLDAQKTFSKKPITQLAVVESLNILISLSDAYVSVHDLNTLQLRSQLPKSKGALLFSLDTTVFEQDQPAPKPGTKQHLNLCVATKKKLVIFAWDGNDFIEIRELALPDSAKTLVWCGDSVCVGFKKEYNLINVQTGAMTELFPTGRNQTPLACLIPGQQVLLDRDTTSIFIGFDSKPTRKFGVTWTEPPIVKAYCFPYILGVQSKCIEVRTLTASQTLVQTIHLRQLKCLACKHDIVYVAALNNVWRLTSVPILNQVDQLIADKEYEEALELASNLKDSDPNKVPTMKSIKKLYTYHLFCQGQYERAMEYFLEVDSDPFEVIGLFGTTPQTSLLPRDLRPKYNYPIDIPPFTGSQLDKAYQALIHYLQQVRNTTQVSFLRNSKSENTGSDNNNTEDYATCSDLLTVIDTTLMKAFIKVDPSQLADFLTKPNYVHLKEAERVLPLSKRELELVYLYKSKKIHKNALDLLVKLNNVNQCIAYLRDLGKDNLDLILEYSKWPLQQSPQQALEIFTEPRPKDQELPAGAVVSHLKSSAATSQLLTPFLEYVIYKRKDTSPEFHNELVFLYLDTITPLKREFAAKPGTVVRAGTETGLLGTTRKKLLAFLEDSQYYNPEKMLSKQTFEDLYEERAILLSRIGQHEKALSIYAHLLKDHAMAESYCARHYNPEKEESRDVYVSLMKVYLKPAGEIPPQVGPALALLQKYYTKIDLPKALELLPGNTPIMELFQIFENAIRDNSTTRRNNQIIKNLLRSENFQVREKQIHARSRFIHIHEDRVCPCCNKKFSANVPPVCYPSGTVIHYGCWTNLKDKNMDPVTKTVYSSKDSVPKY